MRPRPRRARSGADGLLDVWAALRDERGRGCSCRLRSTSTFHALVDRVAIIPVHARHRTSLLRAKLEPEARGLCSRRAEVASERLLYEPRQGLSLSRRSLLRLSKEAVVD